MSLTLSELINRARTGSINLIREAIAEQDTASRVHAEPAPRDQHGQIVCDPEGLKSPLRYDFYVENTSRPQNADSSTLKLPDPLFAEWSHGMRVKINSVSWDYMAFSLSPATENQDWSWLSAWFISWFDMADLKSPGEHGLYGVVHFISDPEVQQSRAQFFVDFGSAEADSFTSLLDALAQQGFSLCEIGEPEPAG